MDLTVPKSFHPLLQNIKSKAVRGCVIDFIRNQGFRQDIFVKEYKGAKEVKVKDLYDGIKDNLEKVLKVFKENLYPMIVKELRLI